MLVRNMVEGIFPFFCPEGARIFRVEEKGKTRP